MPHYHFDLHDGAHDGSPERDDAGIELAGIKEAEREAVRLCGGILRDEPDRLAGQPLRISVRDQAGDVLLEVVVRKVLAAEPDGAD